MSVYQQYQIFLGNQISLVVIYQKILSPSELNYKDHTTVISDIYQDLHLYKQFNKDTVKCNYYHETEFNNEIS